jgi:hypothetical protein
MTTSFKFYHDAALTQEITALDPLTATQDTAGVLGAVDKTIYLGSTLTGNKAEANSNPGVDAIVVSIADADVPTGAPASEFKLALTSGGLATAVAGDPLTLSTSITSGVANAVPIYTRRDSALAVAGSYTDVSLTTQTLLETPV